MARASTFKLPIAPRCSTFRTVLLTFREHGMQKSGKEISNVIWRVPFTHNVLETLGKFQNELTSQVSGLKLTECRESLKVNNVTNLVPTTHAFLVEVKNLVSV